jgi:hypothetical protein
LTGTLDLLPYSDLTLSGEAFGAENFFRLRLHPEGSADFGWKMYTALSSLELFGVVTDIKDLSFAAQLDGALDLSEWQNGFKVHIGKPALVSIGFDLVANSIQINIKGKIPDLAQTTEVMPMNWLGAFYNLDYKADPSRYSLGALW